MIRISLAVCLTISFLYSFGQNTPFLSGDNFPEMDEKKFHIQQLSPFGVGNSQFRLDSIFSTSTSVSFLDNRVYFYYSEDDLRIEEITSRRADSISPWFDYRIEALNFDERGNLISTSYENYDFGSSSWKLLQSAEYTYNEVNKVIEQTEINSYQEDSNEPFLAIKTFFTYDENDNVSEEVQQTYYPYLKSYLNSHRRLMTYSENGLLLEEVNYNASSDTTWRLATLEKYIRNPDGKLTQWGIIGKNPNQAGLDTTRWQWRTFNNQGLLEEVATFYFNPLGESVRKYPRFKYSYFYNEDNLLTERILEENFSAEGPSKLTWKSMFEYNESGKTTGRASAKWISGEWVTTDSLVSRFDQDDYLTHEISYRLSFFDSVLVRTRDVNFKYKRGIFSDQIQLPYFITYPLTNFIIDSTRIHPVFTHKLDSIKTTGFDSETGEWQVYSVEKYHYSDQALSTSIDLLNQKEILLYPNPSKGIVQFDFYSVLRGNLRIFDSSGRLLIKQEIRPMETVNIDLLPKGVYHYLLQTKKGVKTGKLVKE
ncbi:MAG: T9SS type A sorting domain-containing protein [Bacteroidota bacterium]